MKIQTIELRDFRGTRALTLSPAAGNIVICGDNATGKSAVVDALDFLLTGRVRRLRGPGTDGITLASHGPHIDAFLDSAAVKATAVLPNGQVVSLERTLQNSSQLIATPPLPPSALESASRGHNTLTRREMLQFITATAGTRAERVNQILNLEGVDQLRKTLRAVETDARKEVRSLEAAQRTIEARVATLFGDAQFSDEAALSAVNDARAEIGGAPLARLDVASLKSGTSPMPDDRNSTTVSPPRVLRALTQLIEDAESSSEVSTSKLATAREALHSLLADPQRLRAVARVSLTQEGLRLLDETGACPLCDTPWVPGELQAYLENRLEQSQETQALQATLNETSAALRSLSAGVRARIDIIAEAMAELNLTPPSNIIEDLQRRTDRFDEEWATPLESRVESDSTRQSEGHSFPLQPEHANRLLEVQDFLSSRMPSTSPAQDAWDLLTKFETLLPELNTATEKCQSTILAEQRAKALYAAFERQRDAHLSALYDRVRARFESLYRELHSPDEPGFAATLNPSGPGLELAVDFHGRGLHPPHALHSEGHQDSMGLCLFFALAEHLLAGRVGFLVLDDVVMSVDATHRRAIAGLLRGSLSDFQFFITTHERAWANQLRSAGVVTSKNLIRFYGWTVESGPQLLTSGDPWESIANLTHRGEVNLAAAALRRLLEEKSAVSCNALGAQVRFRLDQTWELGELLPQAYSTFMKRIRKAKDVAGKTGHTARIAEIQKIEGRLRAAHVAASIERWSINPAVHYNAWENFTHTEFESVVVTHRELCAAFRCDQCEQEFHVVWNRGQPDTLRCLCGHHSYPLS